MLKELNETADTEWKEIRRIMSHEIQNFNKEVEFFFFKTEPNKHLGLNIQ